MINQVLLARWRSVLVFNIGVNNDAHIGQLPKPGLFPDKFPDQSGGGAPTSFAFVLGLAFLKLYRAWPEDYKRDLDPCGGSLVCARAWLGEWLRKLPAEYQKTIWDGFMGTVGSVVDLALNAPASLSILRDRINALDNEMLHALGMQAVQGKRLEPDLFERLL